MSIRVLIVDDEAPTRQLLTDLCRNQRDLHLVDPCSSASAAIKRLAGGGVDLLLLDIQLGPLTGFDVLHEVPPLRMPLVIFVTAYEQHAVRAFEERAIDYLLKPVNEVRFNKAIERARQQLARPADMAGLQDQLRAALLPLQRAVLAATHRDGLPYLVAERHGAYHVIGVQQIEYIDVEAESNYVSVHVAGESDPCLKRDTLQALMSALDSREFLRVRRNCIVNLEHVERIERILQPYLFNRTLSAALTSEVRADKQQYFILSILRVKTSLNKQVTQYTVATFDWTLERVRPELLVDSSRYQGVFSAFRDEDREQFNSILSFTLQSDHTNDPFSPTEGYFRSISLEESGILPKLVTVGLPFTQYYKTTLMGRWYRDLTSTRYNILALKAKTGYQDTYGESKTTDAHIPLNRRFFAGGSGSVRGWKARELGAMSDDLLELGGNFILEGSVEMRVNYMRGFGKFLGLKLDNVWGVYFLDVGNVWSDLKSFAIRDVAVAAGVGFRYESFFGPFRIDYGFRVYDPKGEGARQSIFHKKFFGETLGDAVIHFGIGHAF